MICKGFGGYTVHVDFSACCEGERVEGGRGFELRFPRQNFETVSKRKLEWRQANGKPIAVILRIDNYKGDLTLPSSGKVGEVFMVKG